jgi:hypothetical protein
MTAQTVALDTVKHRTIEDILQEVWRQQTPLTIFLADDQTITLQPNPPLKPLLTLEGSVPETWKNAIYE